MDFIPDFFILMRSGMFTGFLTIGSFLLTMKVFIITTMKEKFYETSLYDEILKEHRLYDPKIKRFDKLENFRCLLKWSIYSCYGTSFLQIILGIFVSRNAGENFSNIDNIFSLICILMAIVTIALVFLCIKSLSENMKRYIEKNNDK